MELSYRIEQRNALVNKMVDGAKALNEFFERALNSDSFDPYKAAEEMSIKYVLTPNQKIYLGKIVKNIDKAIKYVKELENKYGIEIEANGRRKFKDTLGVYRDVLEHDPKDPAKIKNLYSHNICVSIEREPWKEKVRGVTTDGIVHHTNGKAPSFDRKKSLVFFEVPESYIASQANSDIEFNRRIHIIMKGEKSLKKRTDLHNKDEFVANARKETCSHEIRHIIDNIIYNGDKPVRYFEESQTYIFPKFNSLPLFGFVEDAERYVKEYIQPCMKRLESYNDRHFPAILVKKDEDMMKERMEELKAMKNCHKILFDRQNIPQLNNQEMSYLISTTKIPQKLEHRLELLKSLR